MYHFTVMIITLEKCEKKLDEAIWLLQKRVVIPKRKKEKKDEGIPFHFLWPDTQETQVKKSGT